MFGQHLVIFYDLQGLRDAGKADGSSRLCAVLSVGHL